MKIAGLHASQGRPAKLTSASNIAEETLYPGEERILESASPLKLADRFEAALEDLDKLSGQIAERNPEQKTAAKTFQKIAEAALEKGKAPFLSPYRKLGAYQAALEVISGLEEFDGWNLAQAAKNLREGENNLQIREYRESTFNYAKNLELAESGRKFLQIAAGAMNHHSALAILALGENENSTLKALEAAGRQKSDRLDLELLGAIAEETVSHPLGPVEKKQTEKFSSTLKLLGDLAPLAIEENPQNKAELELMQKLSRETLQEHKCRVKNHKPHFYSSWEHKMDDYCRMGKYQGTLEVLANLKPGFGKNPSARAAQRVLKGTNKFYTTLGNHQKNNKKIQYHLFDGGCYAIRDLAKAAGDEKALKLMKENLPGDSLLEELKNLPGKNTGKP